MKEALGLGATLEEATQDALQQLSADREEVEIEPLDTGSKGFLGIGKKPAQVMARVREDDRIRAGVFMRKILAFMNIQTEMQILENADQITIQLGEEASSLIGHRGQVLDSLQYLVARYLNEDKEEWRKVVVDINNYHDRREENLRQMAERMAQQVIRSKRDIRTEPLAASERRIIHMTLKENSAVTTYSIGTGNRKRVVITSTEKSSSSSRRSTSPRRSSGGGGMRGSGRSGGPPRGGRSGGSRRGGRVQGLSRRPPSMREESGES